MTRHVCARRRHDRGVGENSKKVRARAEKSCNLRVGRDAAIAEIASRQCGRITRRQLVDAGISDDAIAHRVATGQLTRLRRGLFTVAAHEGGKRARLRAALLSVGDDATISHLSAAGRLAVRGDPVVVDVTCPRWLPRRDGIRLHRATLEPDEITVRDDLPLTSPARTLFDLGTMLGAAAHANAANEAFVRKLVTIDEIRAARDRYARRKGSAAFAQLLAVLDPEGREIRSPLEVRLNAVLRARGFPPWESNVLLEVGGEMLRPDVLWREQRVVATGGCGWRAGSPSG